MAHPNVAKARDNGHPLLRKKYRAAKTPPSRLHSSAVQHRSATLQPSSTRGAPMTILSSRAIATAFVSLLLMSSAFAQTAAPAAKTETKAPVVHTAASLECSKEADAKGLHGKERKKFRSECKKTSAEKK
jgi:hypothetical protein